MDNPQQNSGVQSSTPSENEPLVPNPALEATPLTGSFPTPASSNPIPVSPPFLGDRTNEPLPFTIGKPPETIEPAIPPEPIPEEKLVPNRILLIVVAILIVVLVVALWWFFRPKAEQVGPGEVSEPPAIEGPSPTPVIPADVDVPVGVLSPTSALVTSPTKTPAQATSTPSTPRRTSPTPIPTVAEKPLPEAGSVSQTFFMIISGVGAILAGILLLL